jgi:hypothetical protein
MTTVTHLPNGKYMMTYECGGCPTVTGTDYEFPVYYRINENPLLFNSSVGYPLVTDTGIQPTSSPYITWSPVGGPNGTIVVSCGTLTDIFVNQELGALDAWKVCSLGFIPSFSRMSLVKPGGLPSLYDSFK